MRVDLAFAVPLLVLTWLSWRISKQVDLGFAVVLLVANWVVWLALAIVAWITMGAGEVAIALVIPTVITIISFIANERENA